MKTESCDAHALINRLIALDHQVTGAEQGTLEQWRAAVMADEQSIFAFIERIFDIGDDERAPLTLSQRADLIMIAQVAQVLRAARKEVA